MSLHYNKLMLRILSSDNCLIVEKERKKGGRQTEREMEEGEFKF